MIELTQLSGKQFWLNPHQIETMERNPDTTLIMIDGKRILVREDVPTVIARIVAYRRSLGMAANEQ